MHNKSPLAMSILYHMQERIRPQLQCAKYPVLERTENRRELSPELTGQVSARIQVGKARSQHSHYRTRARGRHGGDFRGRSLRVPAFYYSVYVHYGLYEVR